jgi:hypothetical protein
MEWLLPGVPVVLHLVDLTMKVRDQLVAAVYLADHFVDPGISISKLPFQFQHPVRMLIHLNMTCPKGCAGSMSSTTQQEEKPVTDSQPPHYITAHLTADDVALIRDALHVYGAACLDSYEAAMSPREQKAYRIEREHADDLRNRLAVLVARPN